MMKSQYIPLRGGLDQVSPAIMTDMGRLISASNYEAHPRGYRRCQGFERLDGHLKPSQASYSVLSFDTGDTAMSEDDVVTGGTSGATGRLVTDATVETGSFAGGNAAGYIVLMAVSGTFQDGEDLEISASKVAEADGTATDLGAENDTDNSTWLQASIAKARADIDAVPGGGSVRGVFQLGATVYAFRDNAASGATECRMYGSTAAGWSQIALGRSLRFTTGATADLVEGETVTGGTSGATAVIRRSMVRTGSAGGGNAAGRLIFSTVTGTFQNGETVTGGTSGGTAVALGADFANTLQPGGRFEFDIYNFFGESALRRVYGSDGVSTGFEFDGTYLCPIDTGMVADTPIFVTAHKEHLFFAFQGGSVQHSSIGNPYQWDVVTGAAEIAIGEEVTGLLSGVSGAMAIFGRNSVSILLGNDSSDWQLQTLSREAGAIAYTAVLMAVPVYFDDRGIRDMRSTDQFGNFRVGTMTQSVDKTLEQKVAAGVTPVGSARVRGKDQYLLFFSDGSGLSIRLGAKFPEVMIFDLGVTASCVANTEDANRREVLYIGAEDGFVYEMNVGTSYDGEAIPAFLRAPFNHIGSPNMDKGFSHVIIDLDAAPSTEIAIVPEIAYGGNEQPSAVEIAATVAGSGGFWDEAVWDQFHWSSAVEGEATADTPGFGQNISIAVISNAANEPSHIIQGMHIFYSPRGMRK